jgi:hypothetical protein
VKAGWLHPINISGRQYLTAEDIEQFRRRAAAGEFAKLPSGAARKSSNPNVAGEPTFTDKQENIGGIS